MFRELRKSGTVNDSTANRMTNTITMPDLLIRSHVRAARALRPAEATAGVEDSVEGVFMMCVPFQCRGFGSAAPFSCVRFGPRWAKASRHV